MKITPVKLLGLNPDSSQQIADTDTSTDVIKISVPQLYNIIKTYDLNFLRVLWQPDEPKEKRR